MSSANETYHHLFVQTQPKSILKKSPSPRFLDSSTTFDDDYYSNTHPSEISEAEKHNNQSISKDNSTLSPVENPLPKATVTSNDEIDNEKLIRPIPCADTSSSPLTSDDEKRNQQRTKTKPKKNHYRSAIATGIVFSSSDNDERKAKLSTIESKPTSISPTKHRQKDMQLDEFMRKYQSQGGIPLPTKPNHDKQHITTKDPINNSYQISSIDKQSINDDTIGLLESIDRITLSSKSLSPLQLLFDMARINQIDRRTKIDQIRQYVEEEIGISAFLTIYKLIKSSQIPINIRQKPFCYYRNFLPHLCCLIMLESEEQKKRF